MNSNQQAPVAPRVSILVDPAGVEGGSSSSSSTTNGGGGIGALRVNDGVAQGNSADASPGSEDMSVNHAPSGPTAIIDDDGDVAAARPSSLGAGAKVDTTVEVADDGVDTVTPREGEAVNVTRDDGNDEGEVEDEEDVEEVEDENNQDEEDEDVADDESDYSYTYEDEDEGHYSGFLIPTEPIIESENNSNNSFAPIAAAAAGGESDVNVVAAEDSAAAGRAGASGRPALPRTISRAASGLSGSSSPVPETNNNQETTERKQKKWREPTRAAVKMSLRAEKEKTGGRRRLCSDLYKIMMADTQEAGFSLEPCDEDSMDKWSIKLFGFDEDSNLAKDLMVCGMHEVHLEMGFPDQYPFEPPSVRVVSPRFKRQTGFVMSGALCMELLTKDGWNPINDIESVIVSIRSLMVVGDGRLQAAAEMEKEAYKKALEGALKTRKARKGGKTAEGDDEDDVESKSSDGKRKRAPSEDANDKSSGRSSAKKATGGSYSASEAQSAYDHLSKYHKKEGWDKSGWWSRKG